MDQQDPIENLRWTRDFLRSQIEARPDSPYVAQLTRQYVEVNRQLIDLDPAPAATDTPLARVINLVDSKRRQASGGDSK